jgi:hypothetical protein
VEKNTFATSAYIAAPHQRIVDYLGDLRSLDEWTLGAESVNVKRQLEARAGNLESFARGFSYGS